MQIASFEESAIEGAENATSSAQMRTEEEYHMWYFFGHLLWDEKENNI